MYTYSQLQVRKLGIARCVIIQSLLKLHNSFHIVPQNVIYCIPQLWVVLKKILISDQNVIQVFFFLKEMTILCNYCHYLHYQIVLRIPQYASLSTSLVSTKLGILLSLKYVICTYVWLWSFRISGVRYFFPQDTRYVGI